MIMEKLSENKKGKHGRPRSERRMVLETSALAAVAPEGCLRTKVDWTYGLAFMCAVSDAGEAAALSVYGSTDEERMAGKKPFPKGWQTAFPEIGRYIKAGGDAAKVVEIVADARKRGFKFSDIGAHFRRLRLGDREGNALALTVALSRTLDRYARRFPKTTPEQKRAAVENLLDALDAKDPEA